MTLNPIAASAPDRDRLAGPALRTFFRIAEAWGLSNDEQMILLGVTARSTFFKWRKEGDGLLPKYQKIPIQTNRKAKKLE